MEAIGVSEGRVEYRSSAATATKYSAPQDDLETLSSIQELDTRGLFLRMKVYERFGNLARHGFLVDLQRVCENKLYLELGFSSPRHLLCKTKAKVLGAIVRSTDGCPSSG